MNAFDQYSKARLIRVGRLCLAVAWAVLGPARASGQQPRVEVARQSPPYYVGEPTLIQFTVEGFDQDPQPTCEPVSGKLPANLRGQLVAANPSVVSRVVQRGRQLIRTQRVTFQIQYEIVATQPGDYEIGPFRIRQGAKEIEAPAMKMSFGEAELDDDMRIRLVLPDKPLYPDQRVPVEIQWWYAADFDNVLKLNIYSPLFDRFRFAPDIEPSRRASRLPIDTQEGRIVLSATAAEQRLDGRRYVVVSAKRTLIPDTAGQFELTPIQATVRRATQWEHRRTPFDDLGGFSFGGSLFGDMAGRRRPARTELIRAQGASKTLTVKPFPEEGRPDSFNGAVGEGFSIDVAADGTVVRVGDPIGLQITVRGEGNLENASLPALSADGGLDPKRFRLPDDQPAGILENGEKRFRVYVRVADEQVGEIPSVAYSWFDPQAERYGTARSKPIALRVMPAQIVSASDVVSGAASAGSEAGQSDAARSSAPPVGSQLAAATAFTLNGADLSLENRPEVVLRDYRAIGQREQWTRAALYLAGFLAVAIAVVDRRRRSAGPEVTARRKLIKQQRSRIDRAGALTQLEAAEQIADALRTLIAQDAIARSRAEDVIAECESILYRRGAGAGSRIDADLLNRARQAAGAAADG